MAWSIWEPVAARAAHAPGAPLVIDDEGTHTLGEVLAAARDAARAVRAAAGDRVTVAIEAGNDWRTLALGLAVAELDGTLALIPPGTPRAEAELAFDDVGPGVVLASPAMTALWTDGPSRAAGLGGWRMAVRPGARGDARERWGDGVLIGLTSGSTGRAKAIVQSEAALRYAGECIATAARLAPGEAIGVVTPLSSGPSFCFGPYLALHRASPVVLVGRWDADTVLQRFGDHDVRWFMGVPTHMLKLAEAAAGGGRDLAGVRAIAVGGGPMTVATLHAAEMTLRTRFMRMFGMTECLGHTTVALDDPDEIRLGTEGRCFPGTEHLVLDAAGAEVAPGATGEAFVRGPSLLRGYAQGGALAAAPLLPSGHFPTGDLVSVSPEGIIRVTGRKKNQIMRAGKGIDAIEVETALEAHPGIVEACVVPVPEPTLGEQAAAIVVPAAGHPFAADVILAHLAERGMAKHKWPEHFIVSDGLPRTATGKVARARATELARQQVGGGVTADV